MENFILYRKQILLKNNREFFLPIPVIINPKISNFLIEISNINELKKTVAILFQLKCISLVEGLNHSSKVNTDFITVETIITENRHAFNFKNYELQNGEYMLLGGKSSDDLSISLSIFEGTFTNFEPA